MTSILLERVVTEEQERISSQHALVPPNLENVCQTLIVDLDGETGNVFLNRVIKYNEHATLVTRASPVQATENWGNHRMVNAAQFISNGLPGSRSVCRVIVFLPPATNGYTHEFDQIIDRCIQIGLLHARCRVCLIGSWQAFSSDPELWKCEESVFGRFCDSGQHADLIRTGVIIDPPSQIPQPMRRLARWRALVPSEFTNSFVSLHELRSAIEKCFSADRKSWFNRHAFLGTRRALRDVLNDFARPSGRKFYVRVTSRIFDLFPLAIITRNLFSLWSVLCRPWALWTEDTISPKTVGDVISLVRPLNRKHVVVAGYNTGVTHFGWRFPGKTVVQTIASGRLLRIRDAFIDVDAGILLKRVVTELRLRGKELYVLPNYSYISMGTVFMVPVHGSGNDVTTLGDTIVRAVIYDVTRDRIVTVRRGDGRFEDYMYNKSSRALVLRLRLKIRDHTRYEMVSSQIESATVQQVKETLADASASHVEIRKSSASATRIQVNKFYYTSDQHKAQDIPRDSLGQIWDRLEENRLTSWLFHTYVRTSGFHVELFLTDDEFDVFWRCHNQLRLAKIQIRKTRRDYLPHSPMGDADRISVDLFMKRKHRREFLTFVHKFLPNARSNPGKHSA